MYALIQKRLENHTMRSADWQALNMDMAEEDYKAIVKAYGESESK